jgi:hypothetical protein
MSARDQSVIMAKKPVTFSMILPGVFGAQVENEDQPDDRPRSVSMHSSDLTDGPSAAPDPLPQQRQACEIPDSHFRALAVVTAAGWALVRAFLPLLHP